MKYKKFREILEARRAAWERLSATLQKGHKKPGSLKK